METKIRKIDKNQIDEKVIEEAWALLREGKLVAFPTETVYGLGADALQEEAARKTYEAKGRPSDNPLIVHIADYEQLKKIAVNIPPETDILAAHFWPGPLTMIFEKSALVPYGTTGGLDTVAVRMRIPQQIWCRPYPFLFFLSSALRYVMQAVYSLPLT